MTIDPVMSVGDFGVIHKRSSESGARHRMDVRQTRLLGKNFPRRSIRRGYGTSSTVSRFGPCAPRTRMRSMSPVRLGPVMKPMKLG